MKQKARGLRNLKILKLVVSGKEKELKMLANKLRVKIRFVLLDILFSAITLFLFNKLVYSSYKE